MGWNGGGMGWNGGGMQVEWRWKHASRLMVINLRLAVV